MCTTVTSFEELLAPSLLEDQRVKSYKNTGSITDRIQSIEVILSDGNTLYLVAKTPPPEELFQRCTRRRNLQKEINFYSTITPTLRYFQELEDIDELNFIPSSHGGRSNLEDDAVLLLENLQVRGYKKLMYFDLATTRQVLRDMASFHATPLALKLKDPKVFDTKIKRYLKDPPEDDHQVVAKIIKLLESEETLLVDKIKEKFEELPGDKAIRAPFSTMIHCQYCYKNILVKNGVDGVADVKLIDFQHCSYGSVAEDLIFFLYTSVESGVLQEHNDGLVEFYHSNFVRVLEECKCDPTPFSLEVLLKEMKIVANESQFLHVVVTLYDSLADNVEDFKEKLSFVVDDFVKRKWV